MTKNSDIDHSKEVNCPNCQTNFAGNYCPHCGQPVKDYDQPVSFIFYNFLGDFFAFDSRFLRTFKYLLFKPGFLSYEFFNGRRIRYAPPMRIFIFVSFILFLLLQIYTERGLKKISDGSGDRKTMFEHPDSTNIIVQNLSKETHLDSIGQTGKENYKINLNLNIFSKTGNLKEMLESISSQLESEIKKSSDPETITQLSKLLNIFRSPEQVMSRILKYLSWSFFLLLPIFALILKLFFPGRKQFYMRHLIFSIHFHSFLFILFTFLTLLYYIFNRSISYVNFIIILFIILYMIFGLRRFYGQSYFKTAIKTLGITLIYNIISLTVVTVVVLRAFGLQLF